MKRIKTCNSAFCALSLIFCGCTTAPKGPETDPQGPTKEAIRVDSKMVAAGFSGDSQHLAILCENDTVYLWDGHAPDEIRLAASDLLSEMAGLGGGSYTEFEEADQLSFLHLGLGGL